MAINFQAALGIHEQALSVRSQRAELLANNIANADTPNYKARDIDFRQLLNTQLGQQAVALKATRSGHIGRYAGGAVTSGIAGNLKYRVPLQPAIDGNTVDVQAEQAEYMRNALRFQSSFTFINGKFRGLRTAIRGE